jgi:cytosine/adenosine deaminase-related metal-dependent hydrolase
MHFLSADKIFNGKGFLEAGSILVLNEQKKVSDILAAGSIEKNRIEHLEGIISPGFINSHCHTELSHMKGKIPMRTGLPGFGKQIIATRAFYKKEEILEHLLMADREMYADGIDACGDICNTNDSFRMKESSSIFYHSFIELLGLHPSRKADSMKAGKDLFEQLNAARLSGSLAPHAPYSTSPELINEIAEFNMEKGLASTIHNQESEEENKFFIGENSGFHDLYKFLQMDLSWFKSPGTNSLRHYFSSLKGMHTVFVHNTFTSEKDISLAKDPNSYWCFCVNANLYIEEKLPDFSLFTSVKENICLGTDSLASNLSLSLVDEANVLLANSKFTEKEILTFMTSNGARALKLPDHFGKIEKGKSGGLNHLKVGNRKINFIKRIS